MKWRSHLGARAVIGIAFALLIVFLFLQLLRDDADEELERQFDAALAWQVWREGDVGEWP